MKSALALRRDGFVRIYRESDNARGERIGGRWRMVTLGVWIPTLVGWIVLLAWLLGRTARAVGSTRGRFRVGLVVVLINLAISIGVGILSAIGSGDAGSGLAVAVFLVVLQLVVLHLLIRRTFGLRGGRALAPLGVYVVMVIAYVGVTLGVIKPYVSESYLTPTPGMSPTLEQGDRFFVSKISRPARWDLVTYRPYEGKPTLFCKRLIGLPGERLRFEGGQVYINDELMTPPAVLAGRFRMSPNVWMRAHYRDGETVVLGSDEYFVMGDNVELSNDSRYEGPSRKAAMEGVVDLVYWPMNRIRVLR